MSQIVKQKDNSSDRTNSRRRFIVKAAAGSAVLSVPGKSVWGACSVSGAMSGHVSRVIPESEKCKAPTISGGRSPGMWKDALDGNMNGRRLADMFPILKATSDMPKAETGSILWVAYEKYIKSIIDNHSMAIDSRVIDSSVSFDENSGISLADALGDPGGVDYNLAAVWLNVFFGFYPAVVGHEADMQTRIETANQTVNHVAIYLFNEARLAMSSPDSLGGTELISFNYNFDSNAQSDFNIGHVEDNEYNRTTPFNSEDSEETEINEGETVSTSTLDDQQSGKGKKKGHKKSKWNKDW